MEECNDQGLRVREKAKQLVTLLKDDERLKNERTKALKAKERFAQNVNGFGSDGSIDGPPNREVKRFLFTVLSTVNFILALNTESIVAFGYGCNTTVTNGW